MGYMVPPAREIPGELDRDSAISVHIQLREVLRNYVLNHSKAGRQLPSERDMAAHFNVARMTLRQAVEALVEEESRWRSATWARWPRATWPRGGA